MTRKAMTPARRKRIEGRDGKECRQCGDAGCALEVHHITGLFWQPWCERDLEADDNLCLLCVDCHKIQTKIQDRERAKAKRLENERNGRPKTKKKAIKYNWPSRKLESRGFRT